jgi:hypothetical protein
MRDSRHMEALGMAKECRSFTFYTLQVTNDDVLRQQIRKTRKNHLKRAESMKKQLTMDDSSRKKISIMNELDSFIENRNYRGLTSKDILSI